MTPEEQQTWTRIDNALAHTAELQAQMQEHQLEANKEIAELRRLHLSLVAAVSQIGKAQVKTEETLARVAEQQEAHGAEMAELRGLHKDTDFKLNALIDALDRNVRRDDGPS